MKRPIRRLRREASLAAGRLTRASYVVLFLLLPWALESCTSTTEAQPDSNPPQETVYVAGETYFGSNRYVEYQAGNLPIVVSAPHGGTLTPTSIPDRTFGVTARDRNTEEVIRAVAAEIFERTGGYPHIVISRLRRTKLDPNREVVEAAQGNPGAVTAWTEYHGFIDAAKSEIENAFGAGFYIDLHGHGHAVPRLELGYLLNKGELALSAGELEDAALVRSSSLRHRVEDAGHSHTELLRGEFALGTLLATRDFPAVPSQQDPAPAEEDAYFTGGYSTARHGSSSGGAISGVQIEMNFPGARDSAEAREAFAAALTESLMVYFPEFFGRELSAN